MSTVVLVDMDNVIADFDRRFRDVWAARHPGISAYGPPSSPPRRRRPPTRPPSRGRRDPRRSGLHHRNGSRRRRSRGPNRDRRPGLRRVCLHQPAVVSLAERRGEAGWIEDNLGPAWRERTIVTKDKTLVRGDVLVDDALSVTGAMSPTWRHVVFDRAFNRETPVQARMTWATWRDALLDREHHA